ncbi:MAG: lysostaphin resistance A-like protein, partial [Rhabdochlamydiaceae bacterium]
MVQDALQGIIFLGLMGFLTNAIAYKYGFFKLPSYSRPPVRLTHVLSVFGIYLGFLFVLPIFILKLLNTPSASSFMIIQFVIVTTMFITLLFYIRTEDRGALTAAIKNPESPSSKWTDFGLGMVVWFIAFPWVGIISQICDFLLETLFNFQTYEQVAVRYLKENLQSPPQLLLALISIIIIAPIVEELLFRGTLQQYLKKFLSVKTSIALTAVIFSCFHFSSSQGIGNFSLIPSLFVFSCFLGYIYERQGSIF